jgi:hypothetical protein
LICFWPALTNFQQKKVRFGGSGSFVPRQNLNPFWHPETQVAIFWLTNRKHDAIFIYFPSFAVTCCCCSDCFSRGDDETTLSAEQYGTDRIRCHFGVAPFWTNQDLTSPCLMLWSLETDFNRWFSDGWLRFNIIVIQWTTFLDDQCNATMFNCRNTISHFNSFHRLMFPQWFYHTSGSILHKLDARGAAFEARM